jgi:hypothetical protein
MSMQGFCCLMQLSTRSEDLVIDTLALRQHVGAKGVGLRGRRSRPCHL